MKFHTALIELYNHTEVLTHFIDIFNEKEIALNIYCSQKVFAQLNPIYKTTKLQFHIKADDQSISTFIKEHLTSISKHKRVYICTALSDFGAFNSISQVVDTRLLIHNALSFLSSFNAVHDLKSFFKFLGEILRDQSTSRRALIKSCKHVAVPSFAIASYLKEKNIKPSNKNLSVFPLSFSRPTTRSGSNEFYQIAIPGKVDPKLKDYNLLIEAFKLLESKKVFPIKLILLGNGSDAPAIVQSFEALESNHFETIHFDEELPQDKYDQILLSSDLLILAQKQHGYLGAYREIMWKTKISGAINDAIKYRIPFIASTHFSFDPTVDADISRYSTPRNLAEAIATKQLATAHAEYILFDRYNLEMVRQLIDL